jgi:hypothetical protein
MLVIEYTDGSEVNIRDTQDIDLIPSIHHIKEIYVDGDEMALLFGWKDSTHGARGITLTGKGLETLVSTLLGRAHLAAYEVDEELARECSEPFNG